VSDLASVSGHQVWRVSDTEIDLAEKNVNYSDISFIGMNNKFIPTNALIVP